MRLTCATFFFFFFFFHTTQQPRQRDIGLEKYDKDPWILFQELFTPTFFIIITIIQVHFLHRDFMELSKYEDQSTTPMASDNTRLTSSGPSVPSTSGAPAGTKKRSEVRIEMDIDGDGDIDGDVDGNASEAEMGEEPSVKKDGAKSSVSHKSADSFKSSFDDNFVTSREPQASSSSFATPSEAAETPVKVVQARRKMTFSEKVPANIADIRLAAADMKDRAHNLWDTAKPRFGMIYEILWRFLEIHMMKVVFISAITVAIIDVSRGRMGLRKMFFFLDTHRGHLPFLLL